MMRKDHEHFRPLNDLEPTLIRSKVLIPSASGLVHRPRLCRALKLGLERKLTLVSAAAGYGKTSALIDFARNTSVPVCWYTADQGDRDLDLFLRYLLGAIAEQFEGFGAQTRESLAARAPELYREPTVMVGDLVNELLDLPRDVVLVIDNYEVLTGAAGIDQFIRRFVEVLPTNCHLMIGSRIVPSVPVTHLVAKGQLVGVTEEDLRFEPGEIREFLRQAGVEVSATEARGIAKQAEGWITGVLLILDLLREGAVSVLRDAAVATSQTYTYLASQVLDRQPPHVRRFLHDASVLREMSPRLCRDALGIQRAHAFLEEVERRHLFLTRFGDDSRATYRYHNLFRDFLHRRLRQQEPSRHADLHRRAGVWFRGEHDTEEAVYHFLAAEAYDEATALMERVAMEWFTRGRVETLLGWAAALPEEARSRAPWLSLYQSRALTDRYDYEGARAALTFAEAGFAVQGDNARLARVYDQRAALAFFERRFDDTISEAERILGIVTPDKTVERAGARRFIGRAYVEQGRMTEGMAELKAALKLFRQAESPYDVLNLLQDLAYAAGAQGRYEEAVEYLSEALPLARRLGSSPQLAGVLNNLGWIHAVRGESQEALIRYEEGLAAARQAGDPRAQANIAEGMATVYQNLGIYPRAEFFYDVAWRIAAQREPALAVLILAARVDMYRWQGDLARALDLVEEARDLAGEKRLEGHRSGLLSLTKGIVLAESGEVDEGLQLLSSGLSFLEDQGAKADLARGHFLKGKAHLLATERPQAVVELRRALALAQEMGTSQFAVVEGQHAPELLELGAAEGLIACRDIIRRVDSFRTLSRQLIEAESDNGEGAEEDVRIYALGEGRVVRGGRRVSAAAWRAAMAKELFFYILLHGPLERDTIGLVFWPDLPAKKVSSNFHSTLYRVRQAVGRDAVVVEGGRYTIGVQYWLDVDEFESLIERARLLPPHDYQAQELWEQAVDLYGGDLLSEVDRSWCVVRRERLRGQHIEALIGLGRCHEVRGAFTEALLQYQYALMEDELREDIHRHIMRVYDELGRPSDAVGQYHSCREILRRELAVEPSRETRRLYSEISGRMQG